MPKKCEIVSEYRQLLDFETYTGTFWQVQPKVGVPIPFQFNSSQKIIYYEMQKMRKAGKPVRLKILKSRQLGVSLFSTAFCQQRTMTIPGHSAISIADKKELPQRWLKRSRRWYDESPISVRPSLAISNINELYFDKMNSRYSIGSEAGQTPGMGDTIHTVHCSELSNWGNAIKVMADLNPCIPSGDVDSTVIWESTGEIAGDWWHEQIMLTLVNGDDYRLVFLPWFIHDEYRKKPEENIILTEEEKELTKIAKKWKRDNRAHAKLIDFKGLCPTHIAWRRWAIKNDFAGDLEMFKSKYPATINEAFLNVASLVFQRTMLEHHTAQASQPVRHVRLEMRGDDIVAIDAPEVGPHWKIWEEPLEHCEYAIGGDVAEGALSDKEDDRSERDYSAAAVLDRRNMRFVATFHGRVPADIFGDELWKAGIYYNEAYLGPEINNNGQATITVLKDYPNLLMRAQMPDNSEERDITKLGWKTDLSSRNLLIDQWAEMCRHDPHTGYENKIIICDEMLVHEEKTFVITKSGKREHRRRCHDDMLFAHMIALQVHLRCPHHFDLIHPGIEPGGKLYMLPSRYAGGMDEELFEENQEMEATA